VVDVPRVGRHAGDVAAAELDAACVGQLETGDQAQRRRLARARRPEHGEELAARDLEVDVVDGDHVTEALDQSAQGDVSRRRGRAHRFGRRRRRVPHLLAPCVRRPVQLVATLLEGVQPAWGQIRRKFHARTRRSGQHDVVYRAPAAGQRKPV